MECSKIKNLQEKNYIPQFVLVITSSETTLKNFFYLMPQLLVQPRGQIHFFTFRYFK